MWLSDAGTSALLVSLSRLTFQGPWLSIPCLPIPLIQSPLSGSVTGCKFFPIFFHFYLQSRSFLSCPSPKCAAHNFGCVIYIYLSVICFLAHPMMSSTRRNLSCIGCGSSRPTSTLSTPTTNSARPTLSSPRFTAVAQSSPNTFYSSGPTPPLTTYSPSTSLPPPPAVNKSAHPLLTPSGRVFAVGGKVQNISSDPLNPCIMYWPDNEPFPEQGQIRPSGLAGIPVSF